VMASPYDFNAFRVAGLVGDGRGDSGVSGGVGCVGGVEGGGR
jgi:hypothetical protein